MGYKDVIKVTADEDIDLTADEFASEAEFETGSLTGVESVTVDQVFDSTPYRVDLIVEYDTAMSDKDTLTYEISTFDFVHNAQ